MSKKKSYMNKSNLINEGFFDKLFKFLKIKDKGDRAALKRSKSIKKSLSNLNSTMSDIEDYVSDVTGEKFRFKKGPFTLKDFL